MPGLERRVFWASRSSVRFWGFLVALGSLVVCAALSLFVGVCLARLVAFLAGLVAVGMAIARPYVFRAGAVSGDQGASGGVDTAAVVSRQELLALVREVRRVDEGRALVEARVEMSARKRALVERLEPGWYEDGEDLSEAEHELEATELLESLAAGWRCHPEVEGRPSGPSSPGWAAMVERRRFQATAAVEALAELELDVAAYGGSFPDELRGVLEDLALSLGGSAELVESRPGCWEANHIRALAAGADYELGEGMGR